MFLAVLGRVRAMGEDCRRAGLPRPAEERDLRSVTAPWSDLAEPVCDEEGDTD